jgi:hypothetical protein
MWDKFKGESYCGRYGYMEVLAGMQQADLEF